MQNTFKTMAPHAPSTKVLPYTTLLRSRRGGRFLVGDIAEDDRRYANTLVKRWGLLAIIVTRPVPLLAEERKSTRLNSSHVKIAYAVVCWKKRNQKARHTKHRGRELRVR